MNWFVIIMTYPLKLLYFYHPSTIATTSNGSSGKGDTNGRLDWVDVDFKKPFLKGGVLTTIRRIAPVYTKIYFDTYKKK